jgi:hypothetical protein
MAVGDIKINSIKIGDMDLSQSKEASYMGFNIYEDIMNPYGPMAEIRVVDPSGMLDKQKINGAYDKEIMIDLGGGGSDQGGGSRKFKLKMLQNKDLNDGSFSHDGQGRVKQYDMRFASEEMLNAQGNYMQKSYYTTTDKVVEDVVKNGFKSKKQIDMMSKTDGKRRIILHNDHPLDAVHKLGHEHVSAEDKSSTYVLFQQTGEEQKYVFATFEKLFKGESVVKLKQTNTLDSKGASKEEQQNSIIWFKPSDSFFTPSRPLNNASEQTFNLTTHRPATVDPKQEKFKFIDSPVYKEGKVQYANTVPVRTTYDKVNNKEKHKTGTAKANRTQFLSYLAQNAAELEVYYNPKIKLGSIIDIDVPQHSDKDTGKGEGQFNGKALVVAIRTKIKPAGQVPRATMILRVVKASYKQGGDGQA